MDGLGGYCAKWNKSEKYKYCIISHICGILEKKQTSEYNKTEADLEIENKLVVTSGEGEGGGEILE